MHQQDTFPSKIFDIIQEIANHSVDGNYLFRGEPEHHRKISSTLYRECERIVKEADLEGELSDFNIENIESGISNQVKAFMTTGERVSDLSILTQLQHYESQTNLIDFTTDFNIALFFACDGQPGENGRVIVQKRNLVLIEQPSGIEHRILAQKSVFVRPKRGYIDPNEAHYKVVCIPANLKKDIIKYLRNTNGITTEKIYNDIHGYIRTKDIHEFAYREFYIALAYQNKAENMENPVEKHELWDKAIERYGKAIDYNPNFHPAYANRSTLYWNKGEYIKARQDRLRAWEIYPDIALDPDTYRDSKGEWTEIQDTQHIADPELPGTRQWMRRYWTGLRKYMVANSSVNCPVPPTRRCIQFSIGRTNFSITVWLAHTRNEIGIWLYVQGDKAEAYYRLLEEKQEEIHNEFGEKLEWNELPENKSSRICLSKVDTDPLDEKYWPDQYEWLTTKLELFNKVFRLRIKALDAADWVPEDVDQIIEGLLDDEPIDIKP